MSSGNTFIRDPDSVLDYVWDWSGWLPEGDSITNAVVTVAGGISKVGAETNDATTVTVRISGGQAGKTGTAKCHITTAAGLQDDRTIWLEAEGR